MDKRDEDAVFILANFALHQFSRLFEFRLAHGGVAIVTQTERAIVDALKKYCHGETKWDDLWGALAKSLNP